jgi:hypothetical protein
MVGSRAVQLLPCVTGGPSGLSDGLMELSVICGLVLAAAERSLPRLKLPCSGV